MASVAGRPASRSARTDRRRTHRQRPHRAARSSPVVERCTRARARTRETRSDEPSTTSAIISASARPRRTRWMRASIACVRLRMTAPRAPVSHTFRHSADCRSKSGTSVVPPARCDRSPSALLFVAATALLKRRWSRDFMVGGDAGVHADHLPPFSGPILRRRAGHRRHCCDAWRRRWR